jgi:hypothetical protein
VGIEAICPEFGCHVALTGGSLYKSGSRKDADILFYRIRQRRKIDKKGLFRALKKKLGIDLAQQHGWVQKAMWRGKQIDFFFPETVDGGADGYSERSEVWS